VRVSFRGAEPVTLDGETFVTADGGDAEQILRAWRLHGERAVEHLEGDFAFVIQHGDGIFAARDRFGVRPLYYSAGAISNDLNRLAGGELDEDSVAEFLLFGSVQDSSRTIWRAVHRVPPAHLLSGVTAQRYWSLPPAPTARYRESDLIDALRAAVADRLREARSAAVMMSGGLDSPSLAALAKESGAEVHAFTAGNRADPYDREPHFAAVAAQHLGIPHRLIAFDDYNHFDGWNAGAPFLAEPIDRPLELAFIDLLREASRVAPVVLTGFGGDALLAESRPLHRRLLRRLRGSDAPPFPHWINARFARRHDLPARWRAWFADPKLDGHRVRGEAAAKLSRPAWSFIFESLHPSSTGVDVTVAHPFFDARVVEIALGIPPRAFVDKRVLREAMRGLLPEEVRLRRKAVAGPDVHADRFAARHADWMKLIRRHGMDRWIDPGVMADVLQNRIPDTLLQPVPNAVALAMWLEVTSQGGRTAAGGSFDDRKNDE